MWGKSGFEGKISEINKRVGPNKAVKEGFYLIYIGENQVLKEKSQKLINV